MKSNTHNLFPLIYHRLISNLFTETRFTKWILSQERIRH